jgi:hypothetical protein
LITGARSLFFRCGLICVFILRPLQTPAKYKGNGGYNFFHVANLLLVLTEDKYINLLLAFNGIKNREIRNVIDQCYADFP